MKYFIFFITTFVLAIVLNFSGLGSLSKLNAVSEVSNSVPHLFSHSKRTIPVCDENNMSNADFTNCLVDKNKTLKNKLNTTYKKILSEQTEKTGKQMVESSQTLWKQYLKSKIDIFFPHRNNPKLFWTGLNACYYTFLNKLIKQRINELEAMGEWLKKGECIQWSEK